MKKLIFPALAALMLYSCGAKQAATNNNSLYEVLTEQPDGGGNIRFFEILSKPEEINMLKGDPHIKGKIKDEDVKNSNFLVMNMGEKSTGGYSIGVQSMEETDDKIIITVKETEPKPGDMVTQNITYPYCIVKINSKKPIDVK
ncbi:MAG TPA: protease complex subunit PrcB family protein [Flavobacterium sp.]|nr:protease complex subunit PrcB family protein [Flavobacterium sp.]